MSHQSGKFLHAMSRKFTVDNSNCHSITVTEKRLKASEIKFFLLSFLFKVVYFDVKFKSDVYSRRQWLETSNHSKKKTGFSGLSRISYTARGFA